MAFTEIDVTTPAGTEKKKFGDDRIREFKEQVRDNLGVISNYPAATMPALKTAVWTTATRPSGDELVDRITGYNETLGYEEYYDLSTTTWIAKVASNALTANALTEAGEDTLLLTIYPIGAIYLSVNSTSPATLFGGTWTQIKDTFLLACGDTYTNAATGGEATHTLTEAEMPAHKHQFRMDNAGSATLGSALNDSNIGGQGGVYAETSTVGSDTAHNNMPPYLAVYMWKRTA